MRGVVIFLILLGGVQVHGQTALRGFLATTNASTSYQIASEERVASLVNQLKSQHNSEEKLLRKSFLKVHQTFLRNYSTLSDFDRLFTDGTYDCLTATALFSHVLRELGFSYEIIETNYHIFLMVKTSTGDVLLEPTDRRDGIITDRQLAETRVAAYCSNAPARDQSGRNVYEYNFQLCNRIGPERLAALMVFNQAVNAYNKKNWVACARLLEQSDNQYASPRCEALGNILVTTIMENSVDEDVKQDCLVHLRNILIRKSRSVASN